MRKRTASRRRLSRPGPDEERRRSLVLRAGCECACASGVLAPPLCHGAGALRNGGRCFPGACAAAAPPRSQRAPRGEEAAAAGWGHFVSAIAAVGRQDGGGRVRDRRRPGPSGLLLSLPLPPSPLSLPSRHLSGCLSSFWRAPRAERRPAGERDRSAEGGARRRGPAGAERRGPACLDLRPPFPSPTPLPFCGAAVEPSLSPRASQRLEGPSAALRYGEQ